MRRVASPRFRKTLELARNVVNITFPLDFGTPVLLKTPDGVAAMFPDHVQMRTIIGNKSFLLHPVGEGWNAEAAMIDLFDLFAARENYQDIIVRDTTSQAERKFIAQESPFSTIVFQRQRLAETSASV